MPCTDGDKDVEIRREVSRSPSTSTKTLSALSIDLDRLVRADVRDSLPNRKNISLCEKKQLLSATLKKDESVDRWADPTYLMCS